MKIPINKSESIIPLRIRASFRNQNKIYKFIDDEWIEGSKDFNLRKMLIDLPKDVDFRMKNYSLLQSF